MMLDPTVIGSALGAGGTVVAAMITSYVAIRKKNAAESRATQLEAAQESKAEALSGHAPYTIAKLTKEVTIQSDGCGSQIQKWEGVKPNQRFENLQIPIGFTTDGPNFEIELPTGKEMEGSPNPIELRFEKVDQLESGTKVLRGAFHVLGTCGPDSSPLSFFWRQEFRGAFLMSREEAQIQYEYSDWKTEYTASMVIVPTSHLNMSVRFPDGYLERIIMPTAVVFLGKTHVLNNLESDRIRRCFTFSAGEASLSVPNPVVGMSYAIAWMPPPAIPTRR